MTILVAVADSTGACFGFDEGSFDSYGEDTVEVVHRRKAFRRRGWLIGFSGSWQVGVMLYHHFTPPDVDSVPALSKFVELEVYSWIRDKMTENGLASALKDPYEVLISAKGQLYRIDNWGVVEHVVRGYAATGSGAPPFAVGAIYSAKKFNKNATLKQLVRVGLAASYEFATSCKGRQHFVSTTFA